MPDERESNKVNTKYRLLPYHAWDYFSLSIYYLYNHPDGKSCSEVSSQIAHFALGHTLIVVCGPIRRAHGIFEWRTSILANAPRVVGPKRLANSKVITGNIDAWIKISKENLQDKKRNLFWLPNKWKKTRTISQPSGIYSLMKWKKILATHHGHFQLLGPSVPFTYL